jgi:hypothetical protein
VGRRRLGLEIAVSSIIPMKYRFRLATLFSYKMSLKSSLDSHTR